MGSVSDLQSEDCPRCSNFHPDRASELACFKKWKAEENIKLIGKIVHYHCGPEGEPLDTFAAMIVGFDADNHAHLNVFPPNTDYYNVKSVPTAYHPKNGVWTFPPTYGRLA